LRSPIEFARQSEDAAAVRRMADNAEALLRAG